MSRVSLYCMQSDELEQLIESYVEDKYQISRDTNFGEIIYGWENWEVEIICVAVLLSQVLEKKMKVISLTKCQQTLDQLLSIPDETGFLFHFEGMDNNFLQYIFENCVRENGNSLEDVIVDITNDYKNKRW